MIDLFVLSSLNELLGAAAAFASVAARAVRASSATAAAAASGVEFLGSCIAHHFYFAFEAEVFANERMIEVHLHDFVGDFENLTGNTEAVGSLHGDVSTFLHGFGVKFAIDCEDILVEFSHIVGVVGETFGRGDEHIECTTGFESFERELKRTEQTGSHAKYKALGLGGFNGVNGSFGAIGVYFKEFVADFDIFAGENFFHNKIF